MLCWQPFKPDSISTHGKYLLLVWVNILVYLFRLPTVLIGLGYYIKNLIAIVIHGRNVVHQTVEMMPLELNSNTSVKRIHVIQLRNTKTYFEMNLPIFEIDE